MNIGLFTDTYFPQVSGVATSIQTLKRELERKGNKVYIFTSTDPKIKKNMLEANIYRFSSVPFAGFKDRRIAVRGVIKALNLAKELKLDIIHTQTEFSLGLIGKFVARQLKIPIVHTYHTNYQDYLHYIAKGKLLKPGAVALIARRYMSGITGVIAPSEQTFDVLREYKIEIPIKIIPTGVDIKIDDENSNEKDQLIKKLNIDKDTFVIVSIGRIAPEKNIYRSIKIIKKLVDEKYNVKFIIVGKGPELQDLKNYVNNNNLSNSIEFVGEIKHDNIVKYYQIGDVFLSTSTSETQGLTFIEAITAETPIVAINSPYLETIILDSSIGTLVNDDTEILEALLTYKNNKENNYKLFNSDKRMEVLSKIDKKKFGEKITAFYDEMINIYREEENIEEANEQDEEYARVFLKTPLRKDNYDKN